MARKNEVGSKIDMPPVKVDGTASVLAKAGASDLEGYHLLVYAPRQHGEGVRTEDNGTLVSDIVAAMADGGDEADADVLADRFGTTADHVEQAIRYADSASGGGEKGEG